MGMLVVSLNQECKWQILVSNRLFGRVSQYICPFSYRLGVCIKKVTKNKVIPITQNFNVQKRTRYAWHDTNLFPVLKPLNRPFNLYKMWLSFSVVSFSHTHIGLPQRFFISIFRRASLSLLYEKGALRDDTTNGSGRRINGMRLKWLNAFMISFPRLYCSLHRYGHALLQHFPPLPTIFPFCAGNVQELLLKTL